MPDCSAQYFDAYLQHKVLITIWSYKWYFTVLEIQRAYLLTIYYILNITLCYADTTYASFKNKRVANVKYPQYLFIQFFYFIDMLSLLICLFPRIQYSHCSRWQPVKRLLTVVKAGICRIQTWDRQVNSQSCALPVSHHILGQIQNGSCVWVNNFFLPFSVLDTLNQRQ